MSIRHLNFFKLLSGEVSPHNLLLKFLLLLMELQNVERGSIWVRADKGFTCLEAVGDEKENIQGMFIPEDRESIVGWVMRHGRPTIAEVGRDKRHFREAEEELAVKSSLILAYPLFLKDNSVYGVVEIIDTSSGGNRMNLSKEYLDFMQNLVDIGSIALSNAVEFSGTINENKELKQTLQSMSGQGILTCPSRAFTQSMRLAESYASTPYPVLITGEKSTGKRTLAHEIHRLGRPDKTPFVVFDAKPLPRALVSSELTGYTKGAFPGAEENKQGALAVAAGGTLFIDNVDALSLEQQQELLTILKKESFRPLGAEESIPVQARIITASRVDLNALCSAGNFMQDLFFHLNVLALPIAPLRERRGDIPYLAAHFIRMESAKLQITPPALSADASAALEQHPWDGNIDELANVVKQAVTTAPGDTILPEHLPAGVKIPTPEPQKSPETTGFDDMSWEDVERAYANYLLQKHDGVISHAARQAGLKRSTFDSRLKKLGLRH